MTGSGSTWNGFGYYLETSVHLSSECSANFDDEGFIGEVQAELDAYLDLYVNWPTLNIFNNFVTEYEVFVEADTSLEMDGGKLYLEGSADFTLNGETESGDFKAEIII